VGTQSPVRAELVEARPFFSDEEEVEKRRRREALREALGERR
jgi:hypothetical protein